MRFLLIIVIGVLCGCGSAGKQAAPVDENGIRTVVSHVGEYQANPKAFGALFADGAVPNEATRGKLRGMMTKVEQARVDDTGSSAAVDVVFEVLQTGEIRGPVEWKLVKAGDQWKVSAIAVPGEPAAGP